MPEAPAPEAEAAERVRGERAEEDVEDRRRAGAIDDRVGVPAQVVGGRRLELALAGSG